MKTVVVYIGALYDFYPVWVFKDEPVDFIYVDGLPDSKYLTKESSAYSSCHDKARFIKTLTYYSDTTPTVDGDKLTFRFPNNSVLTYFINTTEEMLTAEHFSGYDRYYLYVCGYIPKSPIFNIFLFVDKIYLHRSTPPDDFIIKKFGAIPIIVLGHMYQDFNRILWFGDAVQSIDVNMHISNQPIMDFVVHNIDEMFMESDSDS